MQILNTWSFHRRTRVCLLSTLHPITRHKVKCKEPLVSRGPLLSQIENEIIWNIREQEAKCPFQNRSHLKLLCSAALRLSRVNEAFSYATSQVTPLLWHELFLLTWNTSSHCPRRIGEGIWGSTGCWYCKISHAHCNNLPQHLYVAVMQLAQFSEVNL